MGGRYRPGRDEHVREGDRRLPRAAGAGTAIGALFFKPAPPNGVGMRCAALDTYSYAEVTVSPRRLTVAMKDARGSRCARRRASNAPRSSSPLADGEPPSRRLPSRRAPVAQWTERRIYPKSYPHDLTKRRINPLSMRKVC